MIHLRIKNARKLKGESIRESAKGLDFKNHQDLARIEKGEKKIDAELLSKLSNYFNVTLDFLMTEKKKIELTDIHWNYKSKF
jgi:transcriptional regulator with XRE-family HTH domain